MNERFEATATLYDEAAAELELAAAHCKTTAGHFRNGEVPRATAHAWAALGHIRNANDRLETQAQEHAERSIP